MYKLDDNPLSRFPEARPLKADEGLWKVAYLKSRREKHFASDIARKGISYYLPLYTKVARRKDNNKQRKTVLPLFPGYLALACGKETLPGLRSHEDLVSVIDIVHQSRFVAELDLVKSLLDRSIALRPQKGLVPGTKVRVRTGVLAGLEGVVVREENETRFAVNVEMFGQSVSARIEESDLSKMEQS